MTEEEKQRFMSYRMREESATPTVQNVASTAGGGGSPGGGGMGMAAPPPGPSPQQGPRGGQQQQSGGSGGVSPQMIQRFMNNGSGAALGAEGGASIAGLASGEAPVAAGQLYGGFGSAPIAVPAAEGLGAGGAGGGGGGGLAAAGPWAALVAAIAINESEANKAGRRDDDRGSRGVDMLSGAVLEQDADALGDKMGGPLGQATKVMGRLGHPEGLLKTSKKLLMPWEWF